MNKMPFTSSAFLICSCLAVSTVAHAGDQSDQSFTLRAQSQDFDKGLGSLRTASFEYKNKTKASTFLVTPTVGKRDTATLKETSVGVGVAYYHDWTSTISTRSEVFVAEDKSPFQHLDFAQDVTSKVGKNTAVTIGGRLSRYTGGQGVWYASGGLRQYFKGGSVAYRLSWTKPDTQSGYLSHLASLTINDANGRGKTQIWLSAGSASLSTSQLPDSFRGNDLAALAQRVQPVSDRLAIIISGGLSSYDRPGSRVTATTVGIGLSIQLN